MATLADGQVRLHYDVEGNGYPVLLIAPGGMKSANALWANAPWNPRQRLAGRYQLIGMDQRNAGESQAPVSSTDSWQTYTDDQLAVLDHLGIEQCHLIGMCIGGPFSINLLLAAPERFRSAVLLQPAGIDSDSGVLRSMYDEWATSSAAQHPEASAADWTRFGDNMWDGDFVLSADRDQVATITTPLLVMMGNDPYHPQSVSREIASLAPNATLIERWKDDEVLEQTDAAITAFLAEHTPDELG